MSSPSWLIITEFRPRPWLCIDRQPSNWCMHDLGGLRAVGRRELVLLHRGGLTRCSSSLSSAPGANAHMADAQLPAYWRIDGRNDTRSGRRLPSTGKNSSAGDGHDEQHRSPCRRAP